MILNRIICLETNATPFLNYIQASLFFSFHQHHRTSLSWSCLCECSCFDHFTTLDNQRKGSLRRCAIVQLSSKNHFTHWIYSNLLLLPGLERVSRPWQASIPMEVPVGTITIVIPTTPPTMCECGWMHWWMGRVPIVAPLDRAGHPCSRRQPQHNPTQMSPPLRHLCAITVPLIIDPWGHTSAGSSLVH